MKRPLVFYTLSYVIGILWGLYFKQISIVLFCVLIYLLIEKRTKQINFFCICFIFLGLIFTIYKTYKFENTYLNSDNKEIILKCTVISNKQEKQYTNAYKVRVNVAIADGRKILNSSNTKLLLYIKNNQDLNYGQEIIAKGNFSLAEGQRNYKGFNYRKYLYSQGIYGIINVNSKDVQILGENKVNILFLLSNNLKLKIIENCNKLFDENHAGVLIGMLIGEIDNITDETKQAFKDASLTHLLAVSGSNVSYIIVAVLYLMGKLKLSKRLSNVIAIMTIMFFIIITGMSSSVIRAGIMGIIMLSSKIFYKKLDVYTSIACSLLLILLYNPYSILDIGLQLSFLGTLRYSSFLQKNIRKIRRYYK